MTCSGREIFVWVLPALHDIQCVALSVTLMKDQARSAPWPATGACMRARHACMQHMVCASVVESRLADSEGKSSRKPRQHTKLVPGTLGDRKSRNFLRKIRHGEGFPFFPPAFAKGWLGLACVTPHGPRNTQSDWSAVLGLVVLLLCYRRQKISKIRAGSDKKADSQTGMHICCAQLAPGWSRPDQAAEPPRAEKPW